MRVLRTLALITLLLWAALIRPESHVAADSPAAIWTYSHSSFAVDLAPGEDVQVGFAVEMNAADLPGSFRWEGTFGTLSYSLPLVVTEVNPQRTDMFVPADKLMQFCIGGFISVRDQVFQIFEDGSETLIGTRESNAPCNWASLLVTPLEPVQSVLCGANNDTLVLDGQPSGIALVSDSGWSHGQRTIEYEAVAGYSVNGSGVFTFFDTPGGPCVPPRGTPPRGNPNPPNPTPGVGNPDRPDPRPAPAG